MITTPVFLNAIVCFNTRSIVFVFWYKYRLFSVRVILAVVTLPFLRES